MNISDEGLKELMSMDGVRYQIYDDRTGKTICAYDQLIGSATIGVGHIITRAQRSSFAIYLGGRRKISQYQVIELLKRDIKRFEDPIRKKITNTITQSMWDSLISLAFNVGSNSYAVKNVIDCINDGNYNGAAKSILDGPTKSKGKVLSHLVRRRKREALFFLKDGIPIEGSANKDLAMGLGLFSMLGLSAFFGTKYVKKNGIPDLNISSIINGNKNEKK